MKNVHIWVWICLDHFRVHGKIEKQSLVDHCQTSHIQNVWSSYILWVSIVQTSKVVPSSQKWTLISVHGKHTGDGIKCCIIPMNKHVETFVQMLKSLLTTIRGCYFHNLRVWLAGMAADTCKLAEVQVKLEVQNRPFMDVILDEIVKT